MPRATSRREIVRKLRVLGFEGPVSSGGHQYMMKDRRKVWLPNPHIGDVSTGLVYRLIRQADVTSEEWDNA